MENINDAFMHWTTTSMPVCFHWDAAIKSVATIHENGEIFPFMSAGHFAHTAGISLVTELNELLDDGIGIAECFVIVGDRLNDGKIYDIRKYNY